MGPRSAYILGLICLAAGFTLEFVGVATESRWAGLGGVALMVLGAAVIATRAATAVAMYLPGLACLLIGAAAALFAGSLRSMLLVGVVLMAVGAGHILFTIATRHR